MHSVIEQAPRFKIYQVDRQYSREARSSHSSYPTVFEAYELGVRKVYVKGHLWWKKYKMENYYKYIGYHLSEASVMEHIIRPKQRAYKCGIGKLVAEIM